MCCISENKGPGQEAAFCFWCFQVLKIEKQLAFVQEVSKQNAVSYIHVIRFTHNIQITDYIWNIYSNFSSELEGKSLLVQDDRLSTCV